MVFERFVLKNGKNNFGVRKEIATTTLVISINENVSSKAYTLLELFKK